MKDIIMSRLWRKCKMDIDYHRQKICLKRWLQSCLIAGNTSKARFFKLSLTMLDLRKDQIFNRYSSDFMSLFKLKRLQLTLVNQIN